MQFMKTVMEISSFLKVSMFSQMGSVAYLSACSGRYEEKGSEEMKVIEII